MILLCYKEVQIGMELARLRESTGKEGKMKISLSVALAAVLGLVSNPVGAVGVNLPATCGGVPLSCLGSSGSRSASATFAINASGDLTVTLDNTSLADVTGPDFLVTALFFSATGTLTPVSALLNGSMVVFGDGSPGANGGGGNVGGEWAYGSGLSGLPLGATRGISTAGFSLSPGFPAPNFGGSNLHGSPAVDGPDYGVTSAGDILGPSPFCTGGFCKTPIIKHSVVFTFDVSPTFTLANIDSSRVSIEYGTSLGAPIPEPATLVLLGSGLGAMGFWGRKRLLHGMKT